MRAVKVGIYRIKDKFYHMRKETDVDNKNDRDKALTPDYDGFYYTCKNCDTVLGTDYRCDDPNYCSKCGQKINWEFNMEFGCIIE